MALSYQHRRGIQTDRLVGEFVYENFIEIAEKEFNLNFQKQEDLQATDNFCNKFDQDCSLNDLKSLLNGFFIWKYILDLNFIDV